MNADQNFKPDSFATLFEFSDEIVQFITDTLDEFNTRQIKLFDLPAYQRIFLFILTRSIKTFSSILVLCRSGYGQDVATLMRSLLENLVTARYIIHDKSQANDFARRFVAYKWVIFKRQLPEQEKGVRYGSAEEKNALLDRKKLILGKVEEFKHDFHITSDRALITWSGKSVRDMAKKVGPKLLEEYEKTFRLCSRFSHPSILGDNEYLIQNSNQLMFSPQPSTIGIESNLQSAIEYALEFLLIADELFHLGKASDIAANKTRCQTTFDSARATPPSSDTGEQHPPKSIRDSIITFQC
ncbi:MAG: DUF5677 domain-containing protein, partial [Candidatus Omnitrophica bacterium]|nr:DUF5677 domain-containing protein [Candidatus Omnitrophota bacterium]